MPATAADIAGASRASAVAAWESATIAGRYPSARDGSVAPAEGYFDNLSDAQAIVDERGALIGTERRRFAAVADGLIWPEVSTSVPQARLVDAEQAVDATFLAARIELDLDAQTTSLELFG